MSLAESPQHWNLSIFLVCDVSGPQDGMWLESLNRVAQQLLRELRKESQYFRFGEQTCVRVIEYADGARLRHVGRANRLKEAEWEPLAATGRRADLGAALSILREELRPEGLGPNQWPPGIILLSREQPTDRWEEALDEFNASPYGMRPDRTCRFAVALGRGADREALARFTGRTEAVFDADATSEFAGASASIFSDVEAPSEDEFDEAPLSSSLGCDTLKPLVGPVLGEKMSQFDTGSVALRKLHFFLLCDVSGSMSGAKIQSLNQVAESLIPLMNKVQADQAQAEMFLRVIEFGEGASIRDGGQPTRVDAARWENLLATGGRTDLGSALTVLTGELDPERLGSYQYPPCIILLSDGQPTDRWEEALEKFNQSPYGLRADRTVRVAVAIGNDANRDVLMRFTGSMETVFDAYSAAQLESALKFVTVASLTNSIRSTGDGLNANASGDAFKAAASQFKASAAPQRDPNDVIF